MLSMLRIVNTWCLGLMSNLILFNPMTLCVAALMFIFWFSIKSISLKLVLMCSMLCVASIITYCIYTIDVLKQKKLKNKKIKISYEQETKETVNICEKEELSLSRIFKK